jgi:hypothetical protein
MTFCGTATIFILTMFAVDRYILVEFYCLDGKSLKHFSTLSIIGSCLIALILAARVSKRPLFSKTRNDNHWNSCSCHQESYHTDKTNMYICSVEQFMVFDEE